MIMQNFNYAQTRKKNRNRFFFAQSFSKTVIDTAMMHIILIKKESYHKIRVISI